MIKITKLILLLCLKLQVVELIVVHCWVYKRESEVFQCEHCCITVCKMSQQESQKNVVFEPTVSVTATPGPVDTISIPNKKPTDAISRETTKSGNRAKVKPNASSNVSSLPVVASGATEPQDPSTSSNLRSMTCRKLQEELNGFMMDLQIQEKLFHDSVKMANEQDEAIKLSGEKICNLQSAVDTLKSDHERISHAFTHIKSQQTEMENILSELESSIPDFVSDVDPERQQLYDSAAGIDRQLMQIALDLKFVINVINERNRRDVVDSDQDPINSILKILNEHTDALAWIEEHCYKLRNSLNDARRNHEDARKSRIRHHMPN